MAHAGDPQGRSRGSSSPGAESRPGGSGGGGCSWSESGAGAAVPAAPRRKARPHQPHRRQQRQQQHLQELQHLESFYERLPPGLVKEVPAAKPEDCIPDVPGNEHARRFLAQAPTKGLWMPLGKEVKVMQCWRCKRYGHRTGDKECPFFIKGNQRLEQFRVAHEDPMYDLIRENKRHEKERRIQQLKRLLDDATSTSSSSSSSSSSGSRKKKRRKGKRRKEKRRKKKRKHKAAKSDREESESD